jgi:hypothetical protein
MQIHTSQGTSRRNRFGRGTYTWWDWSARPNTSPVTKDKNDRPVRTESNDGKHEQREKEGGREGERERNLTMAAAGERTSMRRRRRWRLKIRVKRKLAAERENGLYRSTERGTKTLMGSGQAKMHTGP